MKLVGVALLGISVLGCLGSTAAAYTVMTIGACISGYSHSAA